MTAPASEPESVTSLERPGPKLRARAFHSVEHATKCLDQDVECRQVGARAFAEGAAATSSHTAAAAAEVTPPAMQDSRLI